MKKRYIYTPQDVFKQVTFLRYQPNEQVRALYLTLENELIHSHSVSNGTTYAVSFLAKDIFRMAILCNAAGIILVHNHPSGNIEPSKEDMQVTKKLIEIGKIIGIPLLDHVVVTKRAYSSIKAREG